MFHYLQYYRRNPHIYTTLPRKLQVKAKFSNIFIIDRYTQVCRLRNCKLAGGTVQTRTAKVGPAWVSKCSPVVRGYFIVMSE